MASKTLQVVDRAALDRLYEQYNRREFVHPDPLEFLYRYEDPKDREMVGLIASSLAYGRVGQILTSVSLVLGRMGSPSRYLKQATRRSLREAFAGFRHRFTTGEALAGMLWGAKRMAERDGSLQAGFRRGLREEDETVLPALGRFVQKLEPKGSRRGCWLVATPDRGSACKRWHLFLRWMVRHDAVDPGGWEGVPASKLVVPLDTHMHRIGLALGCTRRKQADGRAAAEVTAAFRAIAPEDPVRYDFALSRLGIRPEANMEEALRQLALTRAG